MFVPDSWTPCVGVCSLGHADGAGGCISMDESHGARVPSIMWLSPRGCAHLPIRKTYARPLVVCLRADTPQIQSVHHALKKQFTSLPHVHRRCIHLMYSTGVCSKFITSAEAF